MNEKDSSKFNRILSQKDVLALAFGAMIGWGWVVLSGEWIKEAGSVGGILAFVAGGIMILFVGLTYAELTAAMPKCGGEHIFSKRALGNNVSFVCTWAIILGYISVVAFEAVAFPTVLDYLIPNYKFGYMYTIAGFDVYGTWVLAGVLGSILITILNYIGIKPAAFLQGVVTILIAIVGVAFFTGSLLNGNSTNMQPYFENGINGIFTVAVMTPFMFVGFDVIPQAAEEIDMPFKNIGKIIILSVIMAIVWYSIIIFGVSRALNHQQLLSTDMAAPDAMKAVFWGSDIASKFMIIAGIGGIITSWNSFFMGGSRAIYAMANSKMLPPFLTKIHSKYKTPSNAVLLVGGITCIAPFFGRSTLVWLTNAGGITIVLAYFLVALSFLVLRKKEPDLLRPYKVKNAKFIGGMAIGLCFIMMILYFPGMPASLQWPYEWAIIIGWSLLGVVFYFWAKALGLNTSRNVTISDK